MKNKPAQKVTIYDIANLSGVAPGTVSRALNNVGYIKKETRDKVEQAVRELDYLPNRVARSLKTKRTELLLLAIPDMDNPFYVQMISAVQEQVQENGYSMILFYTGGSKSGEIKALNMLCQHIADGMIMVNLYYNSEYADIISKCEFPLVLCQMADCEDTKPKNNFSNICIDTKSAIKKMVAHLTSLGHEKIAYIGGNREVIAFNERYNGFLEGMHEKGLDAKTRYIILSDKWLEIDGYEAAKKLWENEDKPTAICCSHDIMALGVYDFLKERNVKIGHDVAVTGMDNIDICSKISPPLTSVDICQSEIGSAAAKIVFEHILMTKAKRYENFSFNGELIIRQSSANKK